MQEQTEGRLIRGAGNIADYINTLSDESSQISRATVYRWIESGRIPVVRMTEGKRSEVWSRTGWIDKLFEMPTPALQAAE